MDLKAYPILYVDDDEINRVAVKYNLIGEFTMLFAESGVEALQILARESVAVLLADHRMPGMTGVDLAEQVHKLYPDIVRVIITAYADNDTTIDAINRGQVNRFVKKPWTRDELAAVMRESIHAFYNAQLIKSLEQRLMQLDRVTSLAIMASAIAHDLRQPLACIQPTVEVLRAELRALQQYPHADAVVQQKVKTMSEAVSDVGVAVDKFKLIASTLLKSLRNEELRAEQVELQQIVESAIAITRGTVTRAARLQVEMPTEPLILRGSEGRLIQLVVNLLLNAAQAIPHNSSLNQRICVVLRGSTNEVCVEVRDTGCGILPEHLPLVFTPFFTTKGSTGSGLGLAICKQIVDEMLGTIEVESQPGRGARFVVKLPRE